MLSADGLPIDAIAKILPKSTDAARPFDMGLIFEAAAAAAYTSIGAFRGDGLDIRFDEANRRSAYLATFTE